MDYRDQIEVQPTKVTKQTCISMGESCNCAHWHGPKCKGKKRIWVAVQTRTFNGFKYFYAQQIGRTKREAMRGVKRD